MKTTLIKLFILTAALFVVSYEAQAQSDAQVQDSIYMVVDKLPEFLGGNAAMVGYFTENVKYPEEAHSQGIQGRVMVQAIIDEDGNVTDPKVIRGVEKSLDSEALRVVGSMPKWIPGEHEGKPVKVRFTFPVVFKLTNPDTDLPALFGSTASKEYSENEIAIHLSLSKGLTGVWRLAGIKDIQGNVISIRGNNLKIINNDGTLYTIVVGGLLPNGTEVPTQIGFFGSYYDVAENTYLEKTITNFQNHAFDGVVSELRYEIIDNDTMQTQYRRKDSNDNWMHEIWTRVK